MPRVLIFEATKDANQAISDLFSFLWPTVVGCWNTRSQIQGFVSLTGRTHDGELRQRFVTGSGVHGVFLRRAYIDRTWEQHLDWFADILLTSLFPIYESWAKQIIHEAGSAKESLATELQFPPSPPGTPKSKKKLGPKHVIAELTKTKSSLMENSVYPQLQKNSGFSLLKLDNMLLAYRYFKEARNCRIHNGGKASGEAVAAYAAFFQVANEKDLNVKKLDPISPFTLGTPVSVSIRSVVGLGEIMLNIMTTVDAELSKTPIGESKLLDLWKKAVPTIPWVLPHKANPRHRRLSGAIRTHKLPGTKSLTDLDGWLKKAGLIKLQ